MRQPILLGTAADGTKVSIDSYDSSFVIAGPSSSGKSTVMIGLLERLIENDFQVCLVDPEGDYSHLENIVTLGSSERPPNITEIFQILQNPKSSLIVNLLGTSARGPAALLRHSPPQAAGASRQDRTSSLDHPG